MPERIDAKAALKDSDDLIEAMEKYPDETLCVMEEGFRLLILKQHALAQEVADHEATLLRLMELERVAQEYLDATIEGTATVGHQKRLDAAIRGLT